MHKSEKITLIVSIIAALAILGGAYLISSLGQDKKELPVATMKQGPVSRTELAKADGKNGRSCLVAVNGIVYQIKDFSLWQDGKHTSSQGQAYCGADLSKVIDRSPHGRKILDILIKIGPLT